MNNVILAGNSTRETTREMVAPSLTTTVLYHTCATLHCTLLLRVLFW
jgi:hypothetical protein